MTPDELPSHWSEDNSQQFLEYGKYFTPSSEYQMHLMVDLLTDLPSHGVVLELCCGEGLLAEQILEAYSEITYWGLDGSPLMLEKANHRLSRFGDRVRLDTFELADHAWRSPEIKVRAVVSSLAIHHLDGEAKRMLFKDIFAILSDGGVVIISDMVEPVTNPGRLVAAEAWDEVVRKSSLELDGSTAGLDFFVREHWNTYRYPDPDDIDHPSPLFDQLKWLEQAGFENIEVHFFEAGHALFSGWKL